MYKMCGNNPEIAVAKTTLYFYQYQTLRHSAFCVFGSGVLLSLAHVLRCGWETAGAWQPGGNFGVHVRNHVTHLTLANRNPFLGPPRKPTNWCLLEKF